VQRIWRAHQLQPHRLRTFKRSRDPGFATKLAEIVGLYVDPPAHAVVLSIDEKSQIQALDRTQPGLPIKPGRCQTMIPMRRREREGKAANGLRGEPARGLARDMGGMVVENDLDGGVGGVGGVEELEKLDEFATAVAFLDQGMDVTGEQIDTGAGTDLRNRTVLSIWKKRIPAWWSKTYLTSSMTLPFGHKGRIRRGDDVAPILSLGTYVLPSLRARLQAILEQIARDDRSLAERYGRPITRSVNRGHDHDRDDDYGQERTGAIGRRGSRQSVAATGSLPASLWREARQQFASRSTPAPADHPIAGTDDDAGAAQRPRF
jgi:hypothetical protein